jgi:purine nucleoside permease
LEWVIISLFIFSAILLCISLFQKDPHHEVEKQLENMSIQLMKEIYYLKKKVKILEEEYMIEETSIYLDSPVQTSPSITRDDVLSMHEEGHSVEDIAQITENSVDHIEELLAH